MARGVSSYCDGDIVESGGGGGGSIESSYREVTYETFSQSSSSSDGYDDSDNDKGGIFFGTNDIEELNDIEKLNGFIYKEEMIEVHRREFAMKSFTWKQKWGWSSIFQCFKFLKAVCCILRRDGERW